MNTFIRWWKFNLVGAVGMIVQLTTLTALNKLLRSHYLMASTIAVETAVIHNFFWHTRYTWRDRRGSAWQQFLRFQCANGLTSLLGNLLLMRFFVHNVHLPVLPANCIAIFSCSLLNFLLSHQWAFTNRRCMENA